MKLLLSFVFVLLVISSSYGERSFKTETIEDTSYNLNVLRNQIDSLKLIDDQNELKKIITGIKSDHIKLYHFFEERFRSYLKNREYAFARILSESRFISKEGAKVGGSRMHWALNQKQSDILEYFHENQFNFNEEDSVNQGNIAVLSFLLSLQKDSTYIENAIKLDSIERCRGLYHQSDCGKVPDKENWKLSACDSIYFHSFLENSDLLKENKQGISAYLLINNSFQLSEIADNYSAIQFDAVKHRRIDILRNYYGRYQRLIDEQGNTIWHIIAKYGNHEIISSYKYVPPFLPSSFLNDQNNHGETPLSIALLDSNLSVFQEFIKQITLSDKRKLNFDLFKVIIPDTEIQKIKLKYGNSKILKMATRFSDEKLFVRKGIRSYKLDLEMNFVSEGEAYLKMLFGGTYNDSLYFINNFDRPTKTLLISKQQLNNLEHFKLTKERNKVLGITFYGLFGGSILATLSSPIVLVVESIKAKRLKAGNSGISFAGGIVTGLVFGGIAEHLSDYKMKKLNVKNAKFIIK